MTMVLLLQANVSLILITCILSIAINRAIFLYPKPERSMLLSILMFVDLFVCQLLNSHLTSLVHMCSIKKFNGRFCDKMSTHNFILGFLLVSLAIYQKP